ncbi:MAG TPA: hypothetical protein VGL37_01055 [Solirubrobacteraceae bacterium]
MSLQAPLLRRVLAALLLPISLVPVLLLAPSLVRAPATLWRHTAHALAPAHPRKVHHEAAGPRYYLVGPARLEIDVLEDGYAGALTPKVGYSPFAEPEWAAQSAAQLEGSRTPSVLIARGRELTTASGEPLHIPTVPVQLSHISTQRAPRTR